MPFFTCELSGESIEQDAVVTPSGHIARRSLLLQALAENGGIDPFHKDRPLSEDYLIALAQTTGNNNKSSVPPLLSASANGTAAAGSLTATLQQLQSEYDAVVLELLDTRRLLQETRQELSQALYQNDAAVRVVARLSMERDQARAALQEWNASGTASKLKDMHSQDNDSTPATKKAKTSSASDVIPDQDMQLMKQAWEALHPTRKSRQKAKKPPKLGDWKLMEHVKTKPASGKTSDSFDCEHSDKNAKQVTLALNDRSSRVTLVSGDSLILYDTTSLEKADNRKPTLSCACAGRTADAILAGNGDGMMAVGLKNGSIDVILNDNTVATCPVGGVIVDVRLHPDRQHWVAATSDSVVALGRTTAAEEGSSSVVVAQFGDKKDGDYSAGALHPDGLIYVAGTVGGALQVWDFSAQTLSTTLPSPAGAVAVTAVAASNNGYHIAAAYANATLLVWDLRKKAVLATLNGEEDSEDAKKLLSITAVQFDDSGKYLAYSGNHGKNKSLLVKVTEVKKWSTVAQFEAPGFAMGSAGLEWGDAWIAVAAVAENSEPRAVFFGM